MLKNNSKKIAILLFVSLLHPMLSPTSQAFAKKKKPMKAYSFIVEAGKASQLECDGEKEIPRRLKKQKDLTKNASYMGSELQSPELKGKTDGEMWKHFFKLKPSCNAALAKTPSAIESSGKTKEELPPDDSDDNDDEDRKTETPEAE